MGSRKLRSIRVAGVVAVVLLAGACATARAFEYVDNVKEALASGQRFLNERKLYEAQVDFENVLLMDPGNETAHLKLFEIYLSLDKLLLARRVLDRLKAGGKTDAGKLGRLEKDLEKKRGGKKIGKPGDPALDADARMHDLLEPDGRLRQAGSVMFSAVDSSKAKTFGSEPPPSARSKTKGKGDDPLDLDDEGDDSLGLGDDEKGGGKKPKGGLPVKVSDEGATASMAPLDEEEPKTADARFDKAVSLAKKKQFSRAIPLYVRAIQEKRSLMMNADFGLLQLSRQAYIERAKKEPTNPNLHFLVGFFHERFSDYDKALAAYEKAQEVAPKGTKLFVAARDKVLALRERQKLLTAQIQREADKEKRQQALERLEATARGEDPELKTADDYFNKGVGFYQNWISKKSKQDLNLACAHMEGAIKKDGTKAEYHFKYAVMKIDEASLGNKDARAVAKSALEKALTLNPSAGLRKEAETLLKTFKTAGVTHYTRKTPGSEDGGEGSAGRGAKPIVDEDGEEWDFDDKM